MNIFKKMAFILLLMPFVVFAQDDLLQELENETPETEEAVSAVFKGVKIVNFESSKLIGKDQFYFVIAHRFGNLSDGIDNFLGLDDASVRIQFLYAPTDWLNIGASRSGFNKTYDLSLKYRFARQQKNGFPVNIVGYNLINVNTNFDEDFLPGIGFSDRLGYANQIIVSRKFNKWLSLEFIPTHFHDNTVFEDGQDNSQFALGFGGRLKISKRFAILADYGLHLNRVDNSNFNDPIALGLEIETGGHVFQLHVSNTQAIYENGFLGQTRGDIEDGDVFLGFNISRAFSFKKK